MFAKIARTRLLSKLARQALAANCDLTWALSSHDVFPHGAGNFARVAERASILVNWVMRSAYDHNLVRRVQLFELEHRGAMVLVLVDSIEDWRMKRAVWRQVFGRAPSPRFNSNVTIVAAPRNTLGLYNRMVKDARKRVIDYLATDCWEAVEHGERVSIAGVTGTQVGDKGQRGLAMNYGVFMGKAMPRANAVLH